MQLARSAPTAAVLAVLGAALALQHGEVWRAGAAERVPIAPAVSDVAPDPLRGADVTFEAWLAARHARTLLTRPWRLFDTPHCAPAERTLTLGMPAIALGVLAVPAALWSGEPLRIYNWARVLASAVCALAVYALVQRWTGRRAAALAAALLFGFQPLRGELASHPPEWDLAWTALALCCADRWLAHGRWRDAAGLAASGALQIAASFYALLSAALLALPLVPWLALRRTPRRLAPAQLAFVAAAIAAAAALLLGPYLAASHAGRIGGRTLFFYAPWSEYAPGGRAFPGILVCLFALVGLAAPRRVWLSAGAPDPRPGLAAGAVLAAWIAAGPGPYAALARVVPGLDAVRDVGLLATAVHLVACVLAGVGFAAAIHAASRYAAAAGAAIVALALLTCFGAGPKRWRFEDARPAPAQIAFFEELARSGDRGPLLELPLDSVRGAATGVDADRALLTAWHGRRTSACYASFPAPGREQLESLVSDLPAPEAVAGLRALGFTTLISHHAPGLGSWLRPGYEAAADGPDAPLRLLAQSDAMNAYALSAPAPDPAPTTPYPGAGAP